MQKIININFRGLDRIFIQRFSLKFCIVNENTINTTAFIDLVKSHKLRSKRII